jgi:hypothetical protein
MTTYPETSLRIEVEPQKSEEKVCNKNTRNNLPHLPPLPPDYSLELVYDQCALFQLDGISIYHGPHEPHCRR